MSLAVKLPINTEKRPSPQKWYFRLVKDGLFNNISREKLDGKLLICNNTNSGTRLIRLFSVFDNPKAFYDYQSDIDYQYKTFLEVILGEVKQKQHFDLDITADMMEKFGLNIQHIQVLQYADDYKKIQLQKLLVTKLPSNNRDSIGKIIQSPRNIINPPDQKVLEEATIAYDTIVNKCLEDIILAIYNEYLSRGIKLSLAYNFAIYVSHSHYKRSFHIIIDKYCHSNNTECKIVYDCIIKRLKSDVAKLIDPKVYSSIQQFRILHNQKPGSNRPKRVLQKFKNIIIEDTLPGTIVDVKTENVHIDLKLQDRSLSELQRSLITYVNDCTLIEVTAPEGKIKNNMLCVTELSESQIEKAMLLLPSAGYKEDSVSIEKIEGSFIILRRKAPTFCGMCKRTHNSENPYLFIIYNTVYLDCRRHHEGKKQCLGLIDGEILNELQDVNLADENETPMFVTNDTKFVIDSHSVVQSQPHVSVDIKEPLSNPTGINTYLNSLSNIPLWDTPIKANDKKNKKNKSIEKTSIKIDLGGAVSEQKPVKRYSVKLG